MITSTVIVLTTECHMSASMLSNSWMISLQMSSVYCDKQSQVVP